MILYSDENTHKLESANKWIESVNYLKTKWETDKKNIPLFLKLAVTAWYILTLDGPELSLKRDENDRIIRSLTETFNLFKDAFSYDENCQWIFGYLMEVRADLFLKTGLDFSEIEEVGKTLIAQAGEKGNIFARVFQGLSVSAQEVQRCVNVSFDPKQEVDRYFIEMLLANF